MLRSLFFSAACLALSAQTPDPLAPLHFLAGEWVGENDGAPGKGTGAFTFTPELGGKALVRRSWAAFPAQNGRPASRHEDLMTVYAEGDQVKAFYVDNEGHAIRYKVTFLDKGQGAVFQTEPQPGPAFRLTYKVKGPDAVTVAFATAPPGQPESFTTHVEGTCLRRK
jgi:hypothetical protein